MRLRKFPYRQDLRKYNWKNRLMNVSNAISFLYKKISRPCLSGGPMSRYSKCTNDVIRHNRKLHSHHISHMRREYCTKTFRQPPPPPKKHPSFYLYCLFLKIFIFSLIFPLKWYKVRWKNYQLLRWFICSLANISILK